MQSIKKSKIKEISATGGSGPGAGATFSPGSGEQFAARNAWIGGSLSDKKKKKLKPTKGYTKGKLNVKEAVSYTPEKREDIFNEASKKKDEIEQQIKKYANIVLNSAFIDFLEEPGKIKKLIQAGEQIEKICSKYMDQCADAAEAYYDEEGYSSKNYEKLDKLSSFFDNANLQAGRLKECVDSIELNIQHMNNDKEFLNLIK